MKIDFEIDTQYGMFKDALHLPDDHGLSEDEINAMKQNRVNTWINFVTEMSNIPSADVIDVPASDVVVSDVVVDPPLEEV